jgi:hypothetical protein
MTEEKANRLPPIAFIVIGPTGSGKTAWAHLYQRQGLDFSHIPKSFDDMRFIKKEMQDELELYEEGGPEGERFFFELMPDSDLFAPIISLCNELGVLYCIKKITYEEAMDIIYNYNRPKK